MNQQKRHTAFDLVLVFVVALLPQLLQSVHYFFRGVALFDNDTAAIYLQCAYLLPSFVIVLYVLRMRGRKPADIGIYEDPTDLFTGVVLAAGSLIAYSLFLAVLHSLSSTGSTPSAAAASFFKNASFPAMVLYAILSAAREELVIRGFMMTSIFSLTNKRTATLLVATCTDFLLFLSYGWLPAIGFAVGRLVLSLYFLRTGKLIPAVLAHIVLNLVFVAQL